MTVIIYIFLLEVGWQLKLNYKLTMANILRRSQARKSSSIPTSQRKMKENNKKQYIAHKTIKKIQQSQKSLPNR